MEKIRKLVIALGIGFATAAVFGMGGVRVPEEARNVPIMNQAARLQEYKRIGHTNVQTVSVPVNDNMAAPTSPQ